MIVWHGIRMMFSHEGLGEQMFDFAKLLLFVSFGYALITFYEAPLPGIGVSFSNLITDQAYYFQRVLRPGRSTISTVTSTSWPTTSCSRTRGRFSPTSCTGRFCSSIAVAKALSLAVIAFGLIASAVCGAAWANLRAVFHRPQARLAVLGLVEVVHPVLVHPRGRDRVPDDLRAVHLPVRDNACRPASPRLSTGSTGSRRSR